MISLPIKEIRNNPNNPRTISKHEFQRLVDSITNFPEMLQARPIVITPDHVVLGGNMRLRAAKAAGMKEVPVYIATWEESKQEEFIIRDNVGFGEWDMDMLSNEWEITALNEWGVDLWDPKEAIKTDPMTQRCPHCDEII